jgi:hypothetical protein
MACHPKTNRPLGRRNGSITNFCAARTIAFALNSPVVGYSVPGCGEARMKAELWLAMC